jgi:hypothetical protein
MESWMINLIIASVGVVGTYAVLRNRVDRLEKDLAEDDKNQGEANAAVDRKIDAGFKRLDVISDRVTILERDTSTHLDMPRAEERFVSHKELQLHIQNIDNTIKHMDKNVEHMSGKLDELTKLLSTNIVKTLSGGAN